MSNIPGPRLAWDRFAAAVRLDSSGNYDRDLTEAERETINNEENDYFDVEVDNDDGWVAIILPEPYDIVGSLMSKANDSGTRGPEYSTDTTNGEDGTWTEFGDGTDTEDLVGDWYDGVRSVNLEGVVGVRFGASSSSFGRSRIQGMHLYGSPSAEPDDRLALWEAESNEPLSGDALDFLNVSRGGSPEGKFRIHNYDDQDANDVTLTAEALTFDNYAALVEFSDDDGSTWESSLNIGTVSAESTSGEILVRVNIGEEEDLGRWTIRIIAEAGS